MVPLSVVELPVPPGAVAPPVADCGCIPKCEYIRWRHSVWLISGQLFWSKEGALSNRLLSPWRRKLVVPAEVAGPGVWPPMPPARRKDQGIGINLPELAAVGEVGAPGLVVPLEL